jgi:hypothetical protein
MGVRRDASAGPASPDRRARKRPPDPEPSTRPHALPAPSERAPASRAEALDRRTPASRTSRRPPREPVRVCVAVPTSVLGPAPVRECSRQGLRAGRNRCPFPAARHHADARGSRLRSFRRRWDAAPGCAPRRWLRGRHYAVRCGRFVGSRQRSAASGTPLPRHAGGVRSRRRRGAGDVGRCHAARQDWRCGACPAVPPRADQRGSAEGHARLPEQICAGAPEGTVKLLALCRAN